METCACLPSFHSVACMLSKRLRVGFRQVRDKASPKRDHWRPKVQPSQSPSPFPMPYKRLYRRTRLYASRERTRTTRTVAALSGCSAPIPSRRVDSSAQDTPPCDPVLCFCARLYFQ